MPDGTRRKLPARGALADTHEIRPLSVVSEMPVIQPDDPIGTRLERLPRDVGWMLFGVGFAGFVAPGIFGLPFMAAGGMILWPNTTNRLQSLLSGRSSKETMAPGMKQIIRFLDDLERRYPATDK